MIKKYYLYPQGIKTEVSDEVYKVFYGEQEKEKYQIRKEQKKNIFYYSDLDNGEILGEDIICDESEIDIVSMIAEKERFEAVHNAIKRLKPDEIEFIKAIYFEGISQRLYSKKTKIPQKTINNRNRAILRKLKKMLNF